MQWQFWLRDNYFPYAVALALLFLVFFWYAFTAFKNLGVIRFQNYHPYQEITGQKYGFREFSNHVMHYMTGKFFPDFLMFLILAIFRIVKKK